MDELPARQMMIKNGEDNTQELQVTQHRYIYGNVHETKEKESLHANFNVDILYIFRQMINYIDGLHIVFRLP
jgi:hypothetical protein